MIKNKGHKKLYYYPPGEYGNPYSINFKRALSDYYDVMESDNAHPKYNMLGEYIFKRSFQAEIYIYNWIENIGDYKFPFIQWLFTILAIIVIKLRGKKLIWMFHNIHPHNGASFYSRTVSWLLFRFSSLIVSHSKDAANYAKSKSSRKVVYKCHPIKTFDRKELEYEGKIEQCDVLIWGSIIRYKGIAEFISLPEVQRSNLRIRIIGKSSDKNLIDEIKKYCNERIVLDEKRASFGEIAAYCKSSKYVLFPYIGDCVSSSGALIDTIAMGGNPVGPNIGAFKDLKENGMCITYKSYKELSNVLNDSAKMKKQKDFIHNNSWASFVSFIYKSING